jgi:hypothetical protein
MINNSLTNRVTKKQVEKLVKNLYVNDMEKPFITCEYVYKNGIDIYSILFSNGAKLDFPTGMIQSKVFRILKHELYFPQNFNFSSDEHDGIVQASLNGENPFAFTILSR